jgi:hypothetical protein
VRTITPTLDDRVAQSRRCFESREKAAIAQMLESYGIPFFYKQPMLINESGQKTIEYADFFLPTYNGLALDYVVDAKSKIYLHKEQVYTQNQMQAVLVTRRDLYKKDWQSTLYKKLERLYHRRPVYRSTGTCR